MTTSDRKRPQRPMDPRLHAEGVAHGDRLPKRSPHGLDYLQVNWSGYALITPGPNAGWRSRTVQELENYYVHGLRGQYGNISEDIERTRELGEPISGDSTARYRTQLDSDNPVAGGGWQFRHLPEWCGFDRSDSYHNGPTEDEDEGDELEEAPQSPTFEQGMFTW
ncbi:hypothetical protein ACT3TB_11070 [Micrococcaceae sp. AOP34-BR2-30]